jgi:hypothetical protein
MASMTVEETKRLEALLAYLEEDMRQWTARRRAQAEAEAEARGKRFMFWDEPTDKDYAQQRLGVDPGSFSRWKMKYTLPNEKNALQICKALGTEKPWEILGYQTLPPDAVQIIVRWERMDQETREAIKRLAGAPQKSSSVISSPASTV